MKTIIGKVIAQTEPVYVQSKKSENGQLAKCYIRIREIGGDYEDEFQAALFGNAALCRYDPGRMVIASFRFQTHESQGGYYQDTVANEIVAL